MKKFSLLALAAAGMLMVGCADKDIAVDENQIVQDEDVSKQFIALNINMPVANSTATRNGEVTDDNNYEGERNEDFELNDGMESEWTVNDATLVVFRPATTADATEYDAAFVKAYNINPEPWKPSADHHVTDYSTKIVQKVGTTVNEGDLALVILNKNELFDITSAGVFQVNGEAFEGTFGDLQKALATNSTGGKTAATEMISNGFYMANSPLTDKAGSKTSEPTGAKLQTLVEIKNVYETEEAARTGECAEIYVERGMAKVTIDGTIGTPTATNPDAVLGTQYGDGVEGVTKADLKLTLEGWVLDHTNASSFMVRSTEGHETFIPLNNPVANKFRYIGWSDITEGNPTPYKYRTYFAKDPNYEWKATTGSDATGPTKFGETLGGLTVLGDGVLNALSAKFGETNPQYCFENTFDVGHQSVNNTTLVRLKITASTGDGADLYIINGNKSVIYKVNDVIKLIQKKSLEIVRAKGVEPAANKTISSDDFTVTLSTNPDADGYKNIESIVFDKTNVSEETKDLITDAQLKSDVTKLYKSNTVGSKDGSILCYKGGVSYYTIRIKHFGDNLTPWKTNDALETPQPSLAIGSYPNWNSTTEALKLACDKNYLGRYGVLRNNWYNLKIMDVKYLGEAVPDNYSNDDTPDDEIEGYIAVKINILSWAKRTQQWSL